MTIEQTKFGETKYSWSNNIHPDNENFMQRVFWSMWEKENGNITLSYKLDYNGKSIFIYGLTKEEAISRYYKR